MAADSWRTIRRDYLSDTRASSSADVVDLRRRSIDDFEEWREETDRDVDWEQLHVMDIRNWIAWLMGEVESSEMTGKGYDEWTVSERFTAMKDMYSWIQETYPRLDVENSWLRVDMSDYRERRADVPRIEAELDQRIRRLSREQIEILLENVPAPETRNRLVIRLMLTTGMRPGEIGQIRLEDVDFDERAIEIGAFKQSPPREVWYPRSLSTLMRKWVNNRRNAYQTAYDSDYLFVTRKKPEMDSNAVAYMFRRAAHDAELITAKEFLDESSDRTVDSVYEDSRGKHRYQYTPHVCRHTFAVEFLESREADAGSVYALKELLGHEDITTTADRYLRHVSDETLERAAKDYAPEF